jgi:Kef-type K+ transport system membrane component KefB
MLLLLFEVGLQLSVRDLFAVGPSSLGVALCGTVSSFLVGWAVAASLLNTVTAMHVFVGAAITATSVGITARVLKDLGASRSSEAKIILGAAIVDDVLALVILALVTGWLGARQAGEAFQGLPAIALVAKTLGFLTLAILLGVRLTPGWFRYAAKLRTPGTLLAVGLCFCFLLSWAASAIGLAALVGAFAAGLILEDVHSEAFVQRGERSLSELIEPMTSFLVPVFFVLVGFHTSVRALAHFSRLGFSLGLVAAAVLGKLACAFGVRVPGARKMTVAIAMIPRGEVTLIFAALGSSLRLGSSALLDDATYTALVAVVIVTTLVTPVALRWSVRSSAGLARLSWTETSGG